MGRYREAVEAATIPETRTSWGEYVPGDRKSIMRAIADLEVIDRELHSGEPVDTDDLDQGIKAAEFIDGQPSHLVDECLKKLGFIKGPEVGNRAAGAIARRATVSALAAGLLISVAPTKAAAAGDSVRDVSNVLSQPSAVNNDNQIRQPYSDQDNANYPDDYFKKIDQSTQPQPVTPRTNQSRQSLSDQDNANYPDDYFKDDVSKKANPQTGKTNNEPPTWENYQKPDQALPPATQSTSEVPETISQASDDTALVWEQQPGAIAKFFNSLKQKPVAERVETVESAKKGSPNQLLNLIAKFESSNNYNAYWHDPDFNDLKDENFTDMTIREVLAWQQAYLDRGSYSTAVGKYQFLMRTLKGLVDEMGIDLDTKFDADTQDKLGTQLLKRRGLDAYMRGKITVKRFAHNLSKEWAALPRVIGKNPRASYYAKDGRNRALVGVDEILRAVRAIKQAPQNDSDPGSDHEFDIPESIADVPVGPIEEPLPENDPWIEIDDPNADPMGGIGELVDGLKEKVDQGIGNIGQFFAEIKEAVTQPEVSHDACPEGTEIVKGIKGSIELCAIDGTEVVYNSATDHWEDKRYGGTTAAGEKRLAVNAEAAEDARNMVKAALADGITLKVTIGYRTEEEQCSIFIRNHSRPEVCEAWIRPVPGNWKTTTMKSNHMDGKSFDVHDDVTLKWMRENAHKFNFIDDVYRAEGWDAKHWTWKRGVSN